MKETDLDLGPAELGGETPGSARWSTSHQMHGHLLPTLP